MSAPAAPHVQTAVRTGLSALFEPRGIVLVGASSTPGKLGAAMAESLAAFGGPVLHVNSRAAGTPGVFAGIAEAVAASPEPVDLAVLCVPAAATAEALREAAAHGVSAALVCAGGFAEAGGAGLEHEAAVRAAAAEAGIRVLGPNTSGFFVPHRDLRASFVPGVAGLRAGSVGVVAASGGVNHVLAFHLERAGVGVSLGVGIGAGLGVTAPDVLEYLAEDEATAAVALHLETVADGPRLLDAVRRLSARKPVVALVVGRNDVSEFAQSHTGALATSWRTTRAVLRQAGAVVVDDETELVDAVTALSGRRPAPREAAAVGLVTAQAGPGLIIADHLHGAGVPLPRLADASQRAIAEVLPPLTFQANPVDTGRPGPGYDRVLRAVAQDPAVDLLGIYAITEPVLDLAAAVRDAGVDGVPAVIGVDGPEGDVRRAREAAAGLGVPVLAGPSALARGLAALAADARTQHLREGEDDGAAARWPSDGAGPLSGPWDEDRAKGLLDALGIRTPERRRATTRAEAHAAFAELTRSGGAVAVKLLDAGVLHKTEIGGVHLGIDSAARLDAALDALEAIGASAFLLERMAEPGVDLVLGARWDPVFGPVVVLGLGGIATEVYADVAVRSLPVSRRSALAMPDELAARELLHGFRGGPELDAGALADAVRALGGALLANPRIAEAEINPLRVTQNGPVALDAVVIEAAATPLTVEEDA
ncbi:acetate--CoA ligase family protein [Sinomonas flava]|uniref:acetate--CoA ligase family protein n=1 Tax=Sinomonas flava TaxID=496857 RepID=UPI0039A6EE07